MNQILGIFYAVTFVLFFAYGFYLDVYLKRVFSMIEETVTDESLLSEARKINRGLYYLKFKWLKDKQAEFPEDIAQIANKTLKLLPVQIALFVILFMPVLYFSI